MGGFINNQHIGITQKTKEAIKAELRLPEDISEEEFNRAAHVYIADCFIRFLQEYKARAEQETDYDIAARLLDITGANLLLVGMNHLFADEAEYFFTRLIDKHWSAISDSLSGDEMDEGIFEDYTIDY